VGKVTWDAAGRESSGGLVHDALLFGSEDELVSAMVPFVRGGLKQGDRTMVVATDRTAAVLSDALHADPRVTYVPHGVMYRRAPATIAAYRDLIEREMSAGARQVRIVAEVGPVMEPAAWARFEAIANRAFGGYPLWSVCMYDRRRLPSDVVATAELTHPYLVAAGERVPSPRFVDPATFLRGVRPTPDPVESTVAPFLADDPVDLYLLRQELHAILAGSPLAAEAVHRFVFAISEVVTNAVVHGRRPIRVRLWSGSDGRSVCAVTDHGGGFDDPFAGYLPAGYKAGTRGMGLWLARQFCDDVTMSLSLGGFTVRLLVVP
jgi:anti-sigma regulatory factor (Ser/Thr protein kinase)